MDGDAAKEMLAHIKRRAEQVSGKQTSVEDIKQMIIVHLEWRRENSVKDYISEMPLEHLLHLLAVETKDIEN